jgi:hypothetical protein
MYPKLKINVYFIFLNIGDLTFGITLVVISGYDSLECLSLIRSSKTLSETKNRPTVFRDVTPFILMEVHGLSGKYSYIPSIFTVKE